MMCGPDMTASGAEITVSRLEMIVPGFLIIISAAEISICVTEINISEPEMIAGVPPIIVSGMKMSVSGPEMIIGLSPIMISLTETIVSLTDLTAAATAMTVSESSMGVDEGKIIVNETGLIALVGKTRAARRRIPMTPRVTAIANSRIASSADSWIFSAPTRSGHMEGSSVRKQQTRVFSVTGIKPLELYCLRHTCLPRWAPKMDPFTLAYLAGHSDISITKRYLHPEDETIKAAMTLLKGFAELRGFKLPPVSNS